MKRIHVAAAALEDAEGRILLTRRHDHQHQGGLWEFPGGKVEPGESMHQALLRELHEELDVVPREHRPLICIQHAYHDLEVVLDVHKVTAWDGEPRGVEGQPLAWVELDRLADYPMPAADRPIVTALQLPPVYWITPPEPVDGMALLAELSRALEQGVRLIQFRVFSLSANERQLVAVKALALCRQYGGRLLINGDMDLARLIGADGVHLGTRQFMTMTSRPEGTWRWIGCSCHNADELRQAQRIGADFAVLSPVLPTASHPDAVPLGWERFRSLVAASNLPVYALGGMGGDQLSTAWREGGQGIAGIRRVACSAGTGT